MVERPLHHLMAWRSVLYAAANLFPSAMGLIVLPLVTHAVSPAEYGLFSLYAVIVGGMLVVLDNCVIIQKTYVNHEKSPELSQAFGASMQACALFTLGAGALVFAGWGFIAPWLPLSRGWVALALITAWAQAVFTMQLALWQISIHVKPFIQFKLAFTLLYMNCQLLALYAFGAGWQGMAYVLSGASIIMTGLGMWRITAQFGLKLNLVASPFNTMARGMYEMLPFRMAGAVFTYAGMFFLASDTAQAGLFMFAFHFCHAIGFGYDSLIATIIPHLVAKPESPLALPQARRKLVIGCYLAAVLGGSVAVALVSGWLVEWLFPASYAGAVVFIYWHAAGRCFHGWNRLVQELGFFKVSRFNKAAGLSVWAAVCYVALNPIFMAHYGWLGAGMALAAGHGLWLLMGVAYYASLVKVKP